MTIRRGSAHYRLSLAGGGTDIGEGEGLCITLSLPWKCSVVRTESWRRCDRSTVDDVTLDDGGISHTDEHPILKHLPNVEPQHHFIVTHELPTRVGLGSSAALALAATECDVKHQDYTWSHVAAALKIDADATGAGWQDVHACAVPPMRFVVVNSDGYQVCSDWKDIDDHLLLFSTGGTHTEARNAPPDERVRGLALEEAHRLRDNPTLKTLAWCMQRQWERKAGAPESVKRAIQAAAFTSGFMAAKSTGSRGAGFGVVLTTQREKARDALVECGARVWLV